ncbi:MAG: HAD family hydrolase [Acidimicrobiales bacterium]
MAEKVVVFDLGNVLIAWDRRLLFEQLIHDPVELDHFLDNVFTLDANRELDRGTPLPEVAAQLADRHPDHRSTILALADRWPETLGGAIDGTVAIFRELVDASVPCYALSNWGADTFAMIESDYEFLQWFDGMVISGREGVIKPDPAIFDLLCERYEFEPEQAVFIDDSATNIASAMTLGFDAILFDGPERLRPLLIERQIL